MTNITFEEFIEKGLKLSDVIFKVTSWEANGYNDSDGDTLYYVPDEHRILHSPWTTRGGDYIVPEEDKHLFTRFVLPWKVGASEGILFDEAVKDALVTDTFKGGTSVAWNVAFCDYDNEKKVLNIPCKYTSNKKEYDGVVLSVTKEHVLFLDTNTNKIHEFVLIPNKFTLPANIEETIINAFTEKASVDDICRYISSKNSCSSSSRRWKASDIRKVACPLVDIKLPQEIFDEFKSMKMVRIKKWATERNVSDVEKTCENVFNKNYSWFYDNFVA